MDPVNVPVYRTYPLATEVLPLVLFSSDLQLQSINKLRGVWSSLAGQAKRSMESYCIMMCKNFEHVDDYVMVL